MANPSVASATAAAFGVPTPMPCIPLTVGPWMTGNPRVLIGEHPSLDDKSTLICAWGGIINIQWPGVNNISL